MNKRLEGVGYTISAGVIFGTVGVLVRAIEGITPLGITFFRLFIAALLYSIFLAITKRLRLVGTTLHDFRAFCLLGFFGSFHIYLFLISLTYTFIANAVLLINTAPIFVLILSPFLIGEFITKRDIAAVIFTFLGSALIIGIDVIHVGMTTFKGDLIALISGFFYALYTIQTRKLRKKYPTYMAMLWFYTFGALVLLSVKIIFGGDFITGGFRIKDTYFLGLLILFPTFVGHILYAKSLGYISAANVSNIALIEAVAGALFAFIIYMEFPGLWILPGIVLVLIGIALSSHDHFKNLDSSPG